MMPYLTAPTRPISFSPAQKQARHAERLVFGALRKKAKKAQPKPSKKFDPIRRIFIKTAFWATGTTILAGTGFSGVMEYLLRDFGAGEAAKEYRIKNFDTIKKQADLKTRSHQGPIITASDDSVIYKQFNYDPAEAIGDFQKEFRQTLILMEDKGFYGHNGVNHARIYRALGQSLIGPDQGGSSITMQLARTIYLNYHTSDDLSFFEQAREIDRKKREIGIAKALEKRLNKEQILLLYMNHIYLGPGVYGFKAACKIYLGKDLDELLPVDWALLATLPSNPNPLEALNKNKHLRDDLLNKMANGNIISKQEAAQAREISIEDQTRNHQFPVINTSPEFNQYVIEKAEERLNNKSVWDSNVEIHTTLDPKAQHNAEAAINTWTEKHDTSNAAIMSVDRNGDIIAFAGPVRDKHDAGATIQPFVYAAALDAGKITPDTIYLDENSNIDGKKIPDNPYSTDVPIPTTVAEALIQSSNNISCKIARDVGVKAVVDVARQSGIDNNPNEPQGSKRLNNADITIGSGIGCKTSLKEMTDAYWTLFKNGQSIPSRSITNLSENGRKHSLNPKGNGNTAFSIETRDILLQLLQTMARNETGASAAIPGRPTAIASGASNNSNMVVGIDKSGITTGVRISPKTETFSSYVSIKDTAAIWRQYMETLLGQSAKYRNTLNQLETTTLPEASPRNWFSTSDPSKYAPSEAKHPYLQEHL